MVAAVTGFVDGYFKGRDWRDSKEDRKLDRARQEKLDKIIEGRYGLAQNADARASATHGAQMSEYEYAKAKRADEDAREADEREFWRKLSGDFGATPSAPQSGAGTDYPIGVVEGEQPVQSDRPGATAAPATPRLSLGALAPSAGGTPAPQDPQRVAMPEVPPQAANESREDFWSRADAAKAETDRLLNETAPAGVTAGGAGGDVAGGHENEVLQQPAFEANSGMLQDPIPTAASERRQQHRIFREQRANQPPQPKTDAIPEVDGSSSAFGQDFQSVKRDQAIRSGLNRIQTRMGTGGSSPIGRAYGAVKDYFGATPEEGEENSTQRVAEKEAHQWYQSKEAYEYFSQRPEQLEQAAQDPVAFYRQTKDGGTGTETVPAPAAEAEETAATAPAPKADAVAGADAAKQVALTFGALKPGQTASPKQMERGSQAYVDRYYETVAPKVVQFYMSQGEPEKAQAYMELIESRQGKLAMKDIGKATFSVVSGDYDGGAEHMLSAFKRYGYADPSMEVDFDETGIVKDESGNAIGGKVVFVDKKTGNRFEKTFATPDEFIEYGHLMTSPATVAELLLKQKPEPKGAITQQDVMKGAVEIMKTDVSGQMTMEQAIQQYISGLGALGVSVGGGQGAQSEPPLYRMGQ